MATRLQQLHHEIVRCRRCPRLVEWREHTATEKVARFSRDKYWGKPVPGFGTQNARLLVVGLAPAAHGGNRTGRMFTGDRSGDWLYRALHKFGFANQLTSISLEDGLQLIDCYITASARCAPPQNKLLPQELKNCRPFLLEELILLTNIRVVIGLGKVACDTVLDAFRQSGLTGKRRRIAFAHGIETRLNDRVTLLTSYHPSQQNTFTGKLTESMFDSVFRRAQTLLSISDNKRKRQRT